MTHFDGGSAFPTFGRDDEWNEDRAHYERVYHPCGGMSLRDWFAGRVLPVLIQKWTPDLAAKLAYDHADAMLKARAPK